MNQLPDQIERATPGPQDNMDLPQNKTDLDSLISTTESISLNAIDEKTISTDPSTVSTSTTESRTGEDDEQNSLHPCAVCSELTVKVCGACSRAATVDISGFKRFFYCSKICQSQHWPEHKAICKENRRVLDRFLLHRAANFLQKVFYVYREAVFDLRIRSIEWKGDRLILHEDLYDPTKVLIELPHSLLSGLREATTRALLAVMACDDAMIQLFDICAMVLRDTKIAKLIEEVSFEPKPGPTSWIFYRNGNRTETSKDYSHCVYLVTLNDGSNWALDLAGAQFGYEIPCLPWKIYRKERVHEINYIHPFGTSRGRWNVMKQPREGPFITSDLEQLSRVVQWVLVKVGEAMTHGIHEGLEKENITIRDMLLDLKCKNLDRAVQSVIGTASDAVAMFKKDNGGFLMSRKTAWPCAMRA